MRRVVAATRAALMLAVAAATATAGEGPGFAVYTDVPRVYANHPARFAELLDRAHTETVRIAMLGDSQESCPVGHGAAYLPAINHALYEIYGNCPETAIATHHSVGGHPVKSPAGWLWLGGSGANSGRVDGLAAWLRPPGLVPRSMTAIPPQSYGWYYTLAHDARNVADTSIRPGEYFCREGDIRAEFIGISAPASGEISWRVRPTDSPPDPFAPVTASGTLTLDLGAPNREIVRLGMTPPLDYADREYLVVEASGTDAVELTRLLGVRFRNLSRPEGMVVQAFSAGGMQLRRLLDDHGGMGPVLAALGYDAFVVHLGANDAFGAHHTASAFRTRMRTLIALLRDAYDDPDLPVIIATDVHRADGAPVDQAEFDRHAGAALSIALEDSAVAVLNLRRITEEDLGWGPDDESYLHDIVHLTPAGQHVLGGVFVEALQALASLPPCPDTDASFDVDVDDLVAVILAWGTGAGAADVNDDGSVDVDDLLEVLLHWGPCPS